MHLTHLSLCFARDVRRYDRQPRSIRRAQPVDHPFDAGDVIVARADEREEALHWVLAQHARPCTSSSAPTYDRQCGDQALALQRAWEASGNAAEALVACGPLRRQRRQPHAQEEILGQDGGVVDGPRVGAASEHAEPDAIGALDQAYLRTI